MKSRLGVHPVGLLQEQRRHVGGASAEVALGLRPIPPRTDGLPADGAHDVSGPDDRRYHQRRDPPHLQIGVPDLPNARIQGRIGHRQHPAGADLVDEDGQIQPIGQAGVDVARDGSSY